MKKIIRLYRKTSPVILIAISLVVGLFLGIFAKSASFIALFGEIFIGALRGIAPVLVFVLVLSSLSRAAGGMGKRYFRVILFYILSTLLASAVSVFASYIFPVVIPLPNPSKQETTGGIFEVFKTLLSNIVENPVSSIANGNYLGILSWAVVFGLALRGSAKQTTKEFLSDISNAVSKSVYFVIQLAPLGIMGLVYSSVSQYGLDIFALYGKLLILLVFCMLTVAFFINPLIVAVALRQNPYPLIFKCFRESGLFAFFTRSSAANIPVNMKLCERLGLSKNFCSVAIPLGATVNMNGAAVTITVMSLAAATSCGIRVDIPSAILLSFLATLAACGASGVGGGSLLLIPTACSLLGIDQNTAMSVVAVGFIIGIVQDSLETALNSAGDVIFCAAAEFMEWKKQGKDIKF